MSFPPLRQTGSVGVASFVPVFDFHHGAIEIAVRVEDNEICRNLFQLILKDGFGCDVLQTKDGLKAVAIAAEIMPDLIQIDIQLPEVSGWNCIRSMRKIAAIDAIPICVVTASGFCGKGDISDVRPKVQAEMEKAVSIPAYVAMVHTLPYGAGAGLSPTPDPKLAKSAAPYLKQ